MVAWLLFAAPPPPPHSAPPFLAVHMKHNCQRAQVKLWRVPNLHTKEGSLDGGTGTVFRVTGRAVAAVPGPAPVTPRWRGR